jgi:DNA-binding response OmpR family regulator
VQLSSRERSLMAVLLDRWPLPTAPSEASRLLWPSASPSENARRVYMTRLRRRLATVGLALRFRPRLGYTIETSPWVLEAERAS